jgi:predicted hotdog family 3-hydroxylacyl-ACP dehydratase
MQCQLDTWKEHTMIEKEELFSVIPHRGRMLLLSRIKCYNLEERSIEAEYHITKDCLFYDPVLNGVPAWAGFEFIAQSISALSGIVEHKLGLKPKFGFILSVSSMRIELPFFKTGNIVEIKTKQIERMDSVFIFHGEISLEGKKIIEGKLTVMDINEEQFNVLKKEHSFG